MPTLNQVEMLELKFLALVGRVDRLERLERVSRVNGRDAAEAELVATQLGYDGDIFVQAFKVLQRRAVARALHEKGWSPGRIAKVMGCCEKTAARWIGAHGYGDETNEGS